ncbi:MAG: hypothetical protein ACMG6H_15940, partial [Acidobacteriota bacterium]
NFLFSPSALTNLNTWYANNLAFAMLGFVLPGIVLVGRIFKKDQTGRRFRPALLLWVFTFLMATPLSRPLWVIVPKLSEVQFPWRWMSITSLVGCVLVAASLPRWKEVFRTNLRPRDLVVGLAFALSLVFVVTQIVVDGEYLNRARFETMTRDIRGAVSFKDWLPVKARDLLHVDLKKGKVDAGQRVTALQSWEPERRQFQIAAGPATEARVRTFFYPHWIATADGLRLPTRAADDGALLISVPANAATVTVEFREPARVRLTRVFSLFSWILIAALYLTHALAKRLRLHAAKPARQDLLLANPR